MDVTRVISTPRPMATTRPRRPLLSLFIALGLATLLVAGALIGLEFAYADKIYPGVTVAGIPVGGKTPTQASAILSEALTPYPIPAILLRTNQDLVPLQPDDVGASLDTRATVRAAYLIGRSGDLLEDLSTRLLVLISGRAVPPVVTYDERQVRFTLERLAQKLYRPAREVRLEIQGLQPTVIPGQPGREMDIPATLAAIMDRLQQGKPGVVDAVIQEHQPAISDLSAAEEKVREFLSGPITLTSPDGSLSFALDPAQLAQMMRLERREDSFDITLDEAALTAEVERWAELIAIEPRDARIDFDPDTGTFTTLVPSQVGRELDVPETVRRIQAAIARGDREAELPVRAVPPAVDERNVHEMGIKELVARGESRFAGSSAARVHNIVTAAEKFRGVVIPPGGEFSFNRIVGDITAANGFEDSLIIWGDRTAVGIGGGVCQVSTTVFRAAFFGGFPILERWAHGYVVSWYGEPGLDATIYTPDVDFRFRNDTEHYLLIKPEVDPRRGILAFSFYGTKPDRQVEMIGPIIENRQPPPDPVYQLDPSLPPGARKQVDWAQEGMDVTVIRIIKDGQGNEIGRDVFVSHYQPWRAVYLVGPEPEPTPTPTPPPPEETPPAQEPETPTNESG